MKNGVFFMKSKLSFSEIGAPLEKSIPQRKIIYMYIYFGHNLIFLLFSSTVFSTNLKFLKLQYHNLFYMSYFKCFAAYVYNFPFIYIVELKYLDEHWSQHSISLTVSTAPPKDKNSNYNSKSEQTK